MATIDDIAKAVAKYAPSLATALTGNLAPAVIQILGEVFNAKPTVDNVDAAIKSADPAVIKANLARAEAAFKADVERSVTLQKQIDANVEMMRMNLDRGFIHSGWRPLSGWAAMLSTVAFICLILFEGFQGQFIAVMHVGQFLMISGPLMALAGVIAWQRSEERKSISNSSASLQEVVRNILGRG